MLYFLTLFRVNCFELTAMLAGKWISKIFEPDETKQIIIDYERFSYEFACEMDTENFSTVLEKYWSRVSSYVTYYNFENGKVNVNFIKF